MRIAFNIEAAPASLAGTARRHLTDRHDAANRRQPTSTNVIELGAMRTIEN
jgi:hypothetical protein